MAEVIDLMASDDDSEDEVQLVSPPAGARRHASTGRAPAPVDLVSPAAPAAPAPARGRKRKAEEAAPAMRRGAKPACCLNDVDQTFELSAPERTALLAGIFGASAAAVHKWRVAHERARPAGETTLWRLVEAYRAHAGPAPLDGAGGAAGLPRELAGRSGEKITTASAVAYARRRLAAADAKPAHDAEVDAVVPAPDGDGGALPCLVCMDRFAPFDVVCCGSPAAELHAVCRPCFRQLCVRFASDRGVGPGGVGCPTPDCAALFAAEDVRRNVAALDVMQMEERERDRSLRVALGGAAAVLRCPCGAVGAVSEADAGDGRVRCPGAGCGEVYCARCGNPAHPDRPCPPPSDMIKWLERKTKKCPKCGEPIEKNAGCQHMTCRCGHRGRKRVIQRRFNARGTKAKWASAAGPSAAGPASPAQEKTVARAPASPERETSSARAIEASEAAAPPPEAASSPPPADDDRAAKLERRVKALEADLAASKQALGDERAAGEATAKKLRRAFNDAKKAWAAEAARLKSDADKAKASADAAVARAKKALDADRAALERKAEVARGANFCANCRRSLLPAPPKPGAKPKYVPKGGDRRPPPRR